MSNTTTIPDGYKRCSKGERCANPNGPMLPATNEFFDKQSRTKLRYECKACRSKFRGHVSIQKQPSGYKRCSSGDLCLHPDGPILPETSEYFVKSKNERSGLYFQCKYCKRRSDKTYYLNNKDLVIRRQVTYQKRYRQNNYEKVRLKEIKYRKSHPELYKESDRRKRANHPEIGRTHGARRRAQERALPRNFTSADYLAMVNYFHGVCAYCGHQPSMFDLNCTLHADHFIPLSSGNCPGTIPTNMLPVCQTCNLSKGDKNPVEWLDKRFGKRKSVEIKRHVEKYFGYLIERKESCDTTK